MTDTLKVSLGAPNVSWTATITLATGECLIERHGADGQNRFEATFEDEALAKINRWANELHERGDFEYRDQFAQAGAGYVVTLDGVSVESRFHLDGGIPDYEELFLLVQKKVFDP